ncbi:MAG TPA: hypothetical protein VHP82_13140 [Gaiellaceae bacterium]|jgi:hypothetical protein|nr:hypothetical protein [Gaiellaceae bacterium]
MSYLQMLRAVRGTACLGLAAVAVAVAPAAALADPPGNDSQTAAVTIDATSSTVTGTTLEATLAKTDPASACGEPVTATVWYSLVNVPARDVVLRLTAQGGLDAVVGVYRIRNGRLNSVDCEETGDDGVATVDVQGRNGDLVLVAQTTGSPPGAFALQALVPQPPEAVPGHALRGVAHASLEEYLDTSDLWHVDLRAGETYRLSLVEPGRWCAEVRLYRPGGVPTDAREVLFLRCNRSASFTPGPDGGGRYLLLVSIAYGAGRLPYRLQIAPARPDDTAPGLNLEAGVWRTGRLHPAGTDQLDMYRFVVSVPSDVIVELGRPRRRDVSLLLLRATGKSLAAGRAIRRPLRAGTYYVVVSAPTGSRTTDYRLIVRERGVSVLTVPELQKGHVTLGTPLTLSALIGQPAGRKAKLEIDRFDPLNGWLFLHTYRLPVDSHDTAALTWRPTHVGTYRVRVTAPSRSSYVYITVEDPPPARTP